MSGRDAGLLQGKPAGETVGRPSAGQVEIARLRRELAQAQVKLARTETALTIMGKARELLEDIPKSEPDGPDVFRDRETLMAGYRELTSQLMRDGRNRPTMATTNPARSFR